MHTLSPFSEYLGRRNVTNKYHLLVLSELLNIIRRHNLCRCKIPPLPPPAHFPRHYLKRVITVIGSRAPFQISTHFKKGREKSQ